MLVGDNYYGVQVQTGGATGNAYYWVSLTSAGSFDGAAVTMYPTAVAATYFNYRDNSLQWQGPPASRVSAGTTVVTSASNIAGTLGVSPAQSVAITLSLYGAGGQPIGIATLQPGQTQVNFNFPVSAQQALQKDAAIALIHENAAKPDIQADA